MTQPFIYITRDIERALGLPVHTPGFFIISNASPFAKSVASRQSNVLLIHEPQPLSSWELLHRPETATFVHEQDAALMVFKSTPQIERFCREKNWKLLNPSAELATRVEGKISQIEWLGDDASLLPLLAYGSFGDLSWPGEHCVVQFNTSHTGSGTHLIRSQEAFESLQAQFPNRPTRILRFIDGPAFTNNNVVTAGETRVGNVSYQITGLAPFTDNPFATVGNDWALGHTLVDSTAYTEIATRVGARLHAAGWKGAFGIDVMQDPNGKLWLIEINARQPASTTFESELQRLSGKPGLTTYEAHILSLQETESPEPLISIDSGAQLVQRVTARLRMPPTAEWPKELLRTIVYDNTEPGSDLVRFQTTQSFLTAHNQLNSLGERIATKIYASCT